MLRFWQWGKKDQTLDSEATAEEIVEDFSNSEAVAAYFYEESGVTFAKQMGIFTNKARLFAKKNNISSFTILLRQLQSDEELKQRFIDYLTTNETYFYREFKQIEALVRAIKQDPIKKPVSILCAPCSTGEEPYSIAIALLEAGISAEHFHITGIDINQEALSKAQKARYKERNVRNLSKEILQRYFHKEHTDYRLDAAVQKSITFKRINIFDPALAHLGKFDYIFSRNMLIYFDQKKKAEARSILESLRRDLDTPIFYGHADLF